mmetsp:Transcript_7540/g.23428  ORF Transcript_7540/g.23428 Transcript_7540/m.23428 type:complete len:221 (-) Transcript_7540:598-1260(-)|eukprot:scaffold173265_cov31-Tisochrysis_lutea.AAC.2
MDDGLLRPPRPLMTERTPAANNVVDDHTARHVKRPQARTASLREAAHQVGRECAVDLLGIGELELGHNVNKLGLSLLHAEARVVLLLTPDGRVEAPLVVVARVDHRLIRQREELVVDRVVEALARALLEVGAPAASNEECVASADQAGGRNVERRAAVGVPRRAKDEQLVSAKGEFVAILEVDVRLGARLGRDGALEVGQTLLHLAGARDVIRVAVRVER